MLVSFYENTVQGFMSNLSTIFFMIGLLISYLRNILIYYEGIIFSILFSLIILSTFATLLLDFGPKFVWDCCLRIVLVKGL